MAIAQENEDYEFTFRIQVAASAKAIPENSKVFNDLPKLDGIKFEDGYYRYFVGKFETFHSSKEELARVQELGYKDAYIICIHEGKRLTVDQAILMIYGE